MNAANHDSGLAFRTIMETLLAESEGALNTGDSKGAVNLADASLEVLQNVDNRFPVIASDFHRVKGDALYRLRDNSGSLESRMAALALIEGRKEVSESIASLCLKVGFLHINHTKDYDLAEAFLTKALSINTSLGDSLNIARTLNDLGIMYYRASQRIKSFQCYKDGMAYCGLDEAFIPSRIRLNFGLARYYREAISLQDAEHYFEKAFELARLHTPGDPVIFNIARDYGILLRELGKFEKSNEVLNFPIQPDEERKSNHRHIAEADLLLEIGYNYLQTRNFKLAEQTLLNCNRKYDLGDSPTVIDNAYPLIALANIYLEKGEHEKANSSLRKARDLLLNHKVYHHVDYADLRLREAILLTAMGREAESLNSIDSGMVAIRFFPQENTSFEGITHYRALSDLLMAKTQVLETLYRNSPEDYHSRYASQLSLHRKFLDFICTTSLDPSVRLHILDKQYLVFDKALAFLYGHYVRDHEDGDFGQMLAVAEQGRDQALKTYHLRNALARARNNDASDLMIKVRDIQNALADIAIQSYANPKSAKHLEKEKQRLSLELEEANAEILNTAGYLEFRPTGTGTQLLANIRKTYLQDNSMGFLEFFIGDTLGYAFLITSGGEECIPVYAGEKEIASAIENCRGALVDHASDNWQLACDAVFQALSAPVTGAFSKGIEHLVVVPHGALYSFPIEVMLAPEAGIDPGAGFGLSVISYANSLQSFFHAVDDNHQPGKKAAFFAPEYKNFTIRKEDTLGSTSYAMLVRSGNYDLPGAKREVKLISSAFGGDRYMGKKATKATFLQNAHRYRILHLSMHAILEQEAPQYSRLLFTQVGTPSGKEDQLFAAELSTLQLNADLAVLSACNTGAGAVSRGEGIQSLSRSFQYAGVPSVVHSLWKVPDDATAQIMDGFYHYLQDGNSKAASLHLAKQQYLKNVVNPQLAHPYYWAGFVLTGNFDALPIASDITSMTTKTLILLLAISFGSLTTFLVWWKKKHKIQTSR